LNPDLYYKKFDRIFILSPSPISELELIYDKNYYDNFSLDWIYIKINEIRKLVFDETNQNFTKQKPINILFIIDDMISSIKAS